MNDSLIDRIREQGYLLVVEKPGGNICAIHRLMYTYAILSECDFFGYGDRWCYSTLEKAQEALRAWSGESGTEPMGWHRHPRTGRRRPDGDPNKEYVQW